MPATELDLPILMSAEQIRRREFVTVRRGYDPDQVRDYLEQLADQVERMAAMIREARLEAAAVSSPARPHVDPYQQLGERVASVIREADQTAERLRVEAQEESQSMLREARADADRIRTDAQARAEEARAEAERTLREAREQADHAVAGLASRRDNLVRQLAQMRERLLGAARELETAIELPPAGEPGPGDRRAVVAGPEEADAAAPAQQRERLFDVPPDPSYEELWEGTETISLQLPDIPPLDLSWGDEDVDPTD